MSDEETKPIVSYSASSGSESVQTVLQRYIKGTYEISNFQRDSDQWDLATKSLFIESVLNNLTVPALFLVPSSDGKYEVVDGQQRLTTLKSFYAGEFALASRDEADYLANRSIYYENKKFQEIRDTYPSFANAFENFSLTLIMLPAGIDESTKREIFRRINQAGTPLSAQDIRLAYSGQCEAVTFVRLAGIYDPDREGSRRMLTAAGDYGLSWPWQSCPDSVRDNWKEWWNEKQITIGQTPSEMFLWFLMAIHKDQLDTLLNDAGYLSKELHLTFDGRTEVAGDIFCAQLLHESKSLGTPTLLCTAHDIRATLFAQFSTWWGELVSKGYPRVTRYRRIAMLLAGLSRRIQSPSSLTVDQWDMIDKLISSPRQTALDLGITLPEAKGRWSGDRGQRAQIDAYFEAARKVIEL